MKKFIVLIGNFSYGVPTQKIKSRKHLFNYPLPQLMPTTARPTQKGREEGGETYIVLSSYQNTPDQLSIPPPLPLSSLFFLPLLRVDPERQ